MANTTISPDMNLPVPNVGEEPGPDWATDINACLNIIDGHTHTDGSGVPITPDAIDINADLPINDNNLTTVRSVRFTAQNSLIADADDLGCIYVSGVDLYYNDEDGNQIRITESGSVTGASGTITGLPSGTASASFAGTTFSWRSATNTPATMNQGPTKIRQAVANGYGVTLTANASQAADYGLTLPLALPSVPGYFSSDTSGNMSFYPLGANIRASEGASTVTLTISDNPHQVFNTTGAVVCKLPSTGVTAGMVYTMENVGSGGTLEIQSSNTNNLCYVNSLYSSVKLIALQATPTSSSHWKVDFAYNEKQYLHGTTYYNGIAPTVTASVAGLSVTRASFIPYQLQDNTWRLNVNMLVSTNNVSGPSSVDFSVVGITCKSGASFQVLAAKAIGINPFTAMCQFVSNQFTVYPATASSGTTDFGISGDVELDSKPTWAY